MISFGTSGIFNNGVLMKIMFMHL